VKGRAFAWDWKAQPDMAAIAALVTEMSRHGRVFMRVHDTGSDTYAVIITDHEASDDEARELYRS
jgi:hypothetical protein